LRHETRLLAPLDALTSLLTQHGLTLVFANVLIAQLGLPLPALPMLVVAGTLVAQDTLHVAPLALVVMIGSLLGDTPWYFAGRRYGYRVLRTLCRISIEPDSCVKQTENIFGRWGPPSLLVAKYIPGFSTVAPPLAGTMGLALPRFLLFSAAAALLWAAVPVAAGYFFSTEVEWLLAWLENMGAGALAVLAAVVLIYAGIKGLQRYLLIRFLRMVRISGAELRQMLDQGRPPIIFDVRSALAREAEPRMLPGAVSVDLDDVEGMLDRVSGDSEVVIYCS
jgi:membrane protein DedA with SNARE-associated domain